MLIIYVHPVERDVALIALTAIDRTAPVVGWISEERDTRLDGKQAHNVACFEGKIHDRLRTNGVTERCVSGVDLCRVRIDGDSLTSLTHRRDVQIQRDGRVDEHSYLIHIHI